MNTPVFLVAGLGNPGARYANTRHNAGYWLVERLAAQYRAAFHVETKFHGEVAKTGAPEFRLLKPATFMNHSGRAVAAVAHFYKLAPEQILIVHDELDLLSGVARLKLGGGHGGHNGLRDIIAQLGSQQFWRLRIGIGHPGHRDQVVEYVLHAPSSSEQTAIDTALDNTQAVFTDILAGKQDAAMRVLHATGR